MTPPKYANHNFCCTRPTVDRAYVMETNARMAGTKTKVPKPICFILSERGQCFRVVLSLPAHQIKKSPNIK